MGELITALLLGSGTGSLIIWVFVLTVAAVVMFYLAFRNFTWARLMEDTPTARIRSAPQGYVELSGVGDLMPGPEIRSPLSGRSCLWYSYKVERRDVDRRRNDFADRGWSTVETGVSDALFQLRDRTGDCVIDPDGALVHSDHDRTWYGDDPRPNIGPPREPSGVPRILQDLLSTGEGRYRYTEQLIRLGDKLYVLGEFETLGTGYQAEFKEDLGALLRSWKSDPQMMNRFDENGDGDIDLQEWQQARAAAQRQVLTERAERSVISVTNLLRKPRLLRRPFLISNHPQQYLARRFRIRAMASITAFFIATATTISIVLTRLIS